MHADDGQNSIRSERTCRVTTLIAVLAPNTFTAAGVLIDELKAQHGVHIGRKTPNNVVGR